MSASNEGPGSVTRRSFLGSAVGGAGALAVFGSAPRGALAQADKPRRGGTLRLGMNGGGSTDTWDPVLANYPVTAMATQMVYQCLVELDRQGRAVPEIAESWELDGTGRKWIFNIRKGVEFHNGKTLDADDVVHTLRRHIGPQSKSLGRSLMQDVTEVSADGKNRVVVTMSRPSPDLPEVLALYVFAVVPNGFEDWLHPVGSGPYAVQSFQHGVNIITKRYANYWKPDRAWYDGVDLTVINDSTARLNALLTGRIDVMNRADRRVVKSLQSSPNIQVVRSPGGLHHIFGMDCRQKGLDDNNIRLALKYGIDRQLLLDTALQGYGRLGNDHPIPTFNKYFNSSLPQRHYDPEKAKFHLGKAGLSTFKVALNASTGAFPEAVDEAVLYSDAARKAGLEIEVVREPADGFWTNVYMKKPFVISYSSGEVTAEWTLLRRFQSQSGQNLCFWNSPVFDKMIFEVREQKSEDTRKEMFWKMQELVSNESGLLVPVFSDFIDAAHKKVMNAAPNPSRELDGYRLAERSWFAA